jgi:hypothetical protein
MYDSRAGGEQSFRAFGYNFRALAILARNNVLNSLIFLDCPVVTVLVFD